MSSIQPTLLCRYRYDPLDWLIHQNKPDQPTHQRFYCKSRLATEIQGAIQHSIVQHGDQLLAQRERQGDVVDTTLLATDLQRSVLQTLKANNERRAIAYSPYGHRPAENGLLSLLGFNGERRDLVTGCYLLGNGYRAFNPVLMRFNCPDSWSPFGRGGLNAYAYCLLDPVNNVDSSGHALSFLRRRFPARHGSDISDLTTSIKPSKKIESSIASQIPGKKRYEERPLHVGSDEQGHPLYGTHKLNIERRNERLKTITDSSDDDIFENLLTKYVYETLQDTPSDYFPRVEEIANGTPFPEPWKLVLAENKALEHGTQFRLVRIIRREAKLLTEHSNSIRSGQKDYYKQQ